MFRHLLIPLDGSPCAEDAAYVGLALAHRLGADVTFTHAAQVWPHDGLQTEEESTRLSLGEALLEHWLREAEGAGLHAQAQVVLGPVASAVAQVALTQSCDLIVMGTHGRSGVNRLLLGSVAEGVARRAHAAVLLVRAGTRRDPLTRLWVDEWARVMVPVDGGRTTSRTLRHAAALAGACAAEVDLVHVLPNLAFTLGASLSPYDSGIDFSRLQRDLEVSGEKVIEDARTAATASGVPVIAADVLSASGWSIGERIVEAAEERRADVIVLGTHAHSALEQLLGGTASYVAHRAPVPVMLVPDATVDINQTVP